MEFIEFHSRIMKIINKINDSITESEFHARTKKIMKMYFKCQKHENHEIHKIPRQNHENYENLIIPFQNHENHKIHKNYKRESRKA